MSKRKSVTRWAIVIGNTAALFLAIYALQYYQSRFGQDLSLISSDTAIFIVAVRQNLTSYNTNDYSVSYVQIRGNGEA